MAQSLQIKNVKPRHEYIAEWLLRNPGRKRGELAAELGISQSHLSVITNSDAFLDYYAQRKMAMQERTDQALLEKVYDLADGAVNTMKAKIEEEGTEMGMGALTDAAKLALNALGFGAPKGAQINNAPGGHITVVAADRDLLEAARKRMRERSVLNGEDEGASASPEELLSRGEYIEGHAFED